MMLERLIETGVRISLFEGGPQTVASECSSSSCGRCSLFLEMFYPGDSVHAALLEQFLQQSVRSGLGTDVAQSDVAPDQTTKIIEPSGRSAVRWSRDLVDV
jgi:hypothetical protein